MVSKPRNFDINLLYHIYNCGVEKRDIFATERDYHRFLKTVDFYRFNQSISFAQFQELSEESKKVYAQLNPRTSERLRVKLSTYCLIPNHFHLSLKPNQENGVPRFMSDISNSYTRYFNIKYERIGSLFQGRYKSKEIPTEEAALQVTRYIHINPTTSERTNQDRNLRPEDYPFSSYRYWIDPALLNGGGSILDLDEVRWGLNLLGGPKKYKEFVEAKLNEDPTTGIENLTLEF